MNGRENIIRMAREAGLSDLIDYNLKMHPDCFMGKWDDLVKLYQLVAAAEREACAKVCETGWKTLGQMDAGPVFAKAIRARGQQ